MYYFFGIFLWNFFERIKGYFFIVVNVYCIKFQCLGEKFLCCFINDQYNFIFKIKVKKKKWYNYVSRF